MLQRDVSPGIHRVADGYVNWYIVTDDSGVLVVDSGHPTHWGLLQEALGQLGRRREDVRALILTHAHYDHMGFAKRIHDEWHVPVHVGAEDQALARHPALFRAERLPLLYFKNPGFLKVFASFSARRSFLARGLGDTIPLPPHGTELDLPGRPVIVATPGHTHGHVSFHFPQADTVVVGDALVTLDPYSGATGPRLVARAATADSQLNLRTLDNLAATKASVLLTGHGEPWTRGAEEAVRLARAAGTR